MFPAFNFSASAPLSMSTKSRAPHHSIVKSRPRPVFFSAALRRLLRQPAHRRLRTLYTLTNFLISESLWWLRHGLSQILPTIRDARSRIVFPLHANIPTPAFDIYVPPQQASYLSHVLSVTPCLPSVLSAPNPVAPEPASPESPPIPFTPVVLYIHGGAWGAGASNHYSQIGSALAYRAQATALILSYRLYPQGRMEHQVDDILAGMRAVRHLFPHRRLTVLAHSSGAHLVSMALLKGVAEGEGGLAEVVILSAGVYDLFEHFVYESQRGVAEVSPMLPAAGAEIDVDEFEKWSPSLMGAKLEGEFREWGEDMEDVAELEGDLGGRDIWLPEARDECEKRSEMLFPKVFLMASSCDKVVPMYGSVKFAAMLRGLGIKCRMLVYDFVEHVDFVADWFEGVEERDLSDILDVGEEEGTRRESVLRKIGGEAQVQLRKERELGAAPHVRDVIRILKWLSGVQESEEVEVGRGPDTQER